MGNNALIYRELCTDSSLGRELALTDLSFDPLDYKALQDIKLHKPIEFPLTGHGVVANSDVAEIEIGKKIGFKTILSSTLASSAIGLVQGGWLPSALASLDNTIVFPDRCVVAKLNGRLREGIAKSDTEKDFIDLFADTAVRINPLMFVLEGDGRKNPTSETIERQLEEAVTKLRAALPKAEIIAANTNSLEAILELIKDTQDNLARKQEFLIRINPKLKSSVSARKRQACWQDVLNEADRYGIPKASLVVLAALSAIVMPQGKNPARKLLKFKDGYSYDDAYNALADIRALEIMMNFFARFPDQRAMLCTSDKPLALFWVGLHAANFKLDRGHVVCDFSPSELLPSITDEQWGQIFPS